MAGSKSDYLEAALLNHVLRASALASPAAVYVALYTTAPTDAGGGVEVSGGAYARQAATFAAPVAGVTSNSATVAFPVATAGWGTVTSFGIFDAPTGGNLLYWGTLDVSEEVGIGGQARFKIGDLAVTED